MDAQVTDRLLDLNRRFYTALAAPFADSRPAVDPGLASIVPYIPQRASVLDIGCGHGRLALLLAGERPGAVYVGVDIVPELLARAAAACSGNGLAATFRAADIAQPGWMAGLPPGPFDCAVALAVLHHLPGQALRERMLGEIHSLLVSGGRLILSTWQFLSQARLRRKIVPWAAVGLAAEDLEPGDYLLDWRRAGRGLRYCHLVAEPELQRLAAAGGWRVETAWRAGGREGDLGLFAVLEAC